MNAPVPLQALRPPPTAASEADLPALRTAVERLRAIIDHSAAGLLVQDDSGRTVDVNAAAEDMLGLALAPAGMGDGIARWRALDSQGRACAKAELPWTFTLRTGEPVRDALLDGTAPDGSPRWLLVNTNVLPRAAGAHWVVSSCVDITTERLLELRLAEQSQRLQTLFDLSPIGLMLYDFGGRGVVDCNDAVTRITGFPRDEILAGALSRHGLAEALAACERRALVVHPGAQLGPLDVTIRHREGQAVEVVLSATGIGQAAGPSMAWLLVQDVSERKRAERALHAAAQIDELTGLPNRKVLAQRLDAMVLRRHTDPAFGFAVLFLDFDRFKLINDTLGHDAGDELLRSIARRLLRTLPPEAGDGATVQGPEPAGDVTKWLVARFGGDEFVILAPGVTDTDSASGLAEQLLRALAPAHPIKGLEIASSASIGIAFASAGDRDGMALLRDADTAMYEAKRRGRRTYTFFDQGMHDKLTRSLHVEEALQRAQAHAQMRLHYQPIIDLETGAPVSAEALLRWMHPTLGAISPAEFVPIAEENGVIVELGRWALLESCAAWSRWQRQQPQASPRSISVNLSRVQLRQGMQLLAVVREALEFNAMPPEALQLEITEREVMQDPDAALILIESLRGLGVRIAMDDFGTGASSLACLREYPFDTVKIDKSFVTDLCGDAQVMAVAHATVSVIENLGKTSVAEGVETAAEVAALQAIGCRYGQGYLFGRPMEETALLAFFAQSTPAAWG